MKKNRILLYVIPFLLLVSYLNVNANIMCKDGTESPSCTDCHSGCCSWHGGCASSSNSYEFEDSQDDNTSQEVEDDYYDEDDDDESIDEDEEYEDEDDEEDSDEDVPSDTSDEKSSDEDNDNAGIIGTGILATIGGAFLVSSFKD